MHRTRGFKSLSRRFFFMFYLIRDYMVININKILVPLDNSKNSFRGLSTAIYLAQKCDAKIIGLHSVYAAPKGDFDTSGRFNRDHKKHCLLYTSPSPRDKRQSRMPSSA